MLFYVLKNIILEITIVSIVSFGGVVQWLERWNHIPNVMGSSPLPVILFVLRLW